LCFSGTIYAAVQRCLARLATQISTWKVSKWSKIQGCDETDAVHPQKECSWYTNPSMGEHMLDEQEEESIEILG
jgi:hypothetical protein